MKNYEISDQGKLMSLFEEFLIKVKEFFMKIKIKIFGRILIKNQNLEFWGEFLMKIHEEFF